MARLLFLASLLCCLHPAFHFFPQALAQARSAPAPAELEALTEAIAAVQARMEATGARRGEVEARLHEAERALAAINARIDATQRRIAGEEAELARLRQRGAGLEAEKAAQQALVAEYLRGAYINGRQEYLKLLLNQESVARSARNLRYYQYFARARAARIADFNATLDALEALRAEIQASSRRLGGQREELAARRDELEAGQLERRRLLDALDLSLAESGSELARLQRERADMQRLIEELSRSIAELSLGGQEQPFAGMKGRLPWPADGPLLNRYGERHALGDLNWQGVTIAAAPGEDIRAIHHGRVVFADWFANSGLLLIIDHGDGYMSLYAHNQTLYREVGDWVASGEAIAAAGNTGGRRENGVYFEIRHEGRAEDPAAWCQARNR